ncbi:Hsp33 family molecular chaperone HslO [Litorimonas sp. RW-G-Af-16]|uniref:Hsp33 family molecular chaperone HslO n=1 Tax=Litorimonas sp. RW-G-Af-16 TaxID=3241168 RepID=UPI00390CC273
MAHDINLDDISDDHLTIFQLEEEPVRGRALRLGDAIDAALLDRYPEPVAHLLGEAMMIGALVARSLKFKGRLVVQCHGTNDGPVSLLMADSTTDGGIRGYARWDADVLKDMLLDNRNPGADDLLGRGTFSMTIDQGPDMDQYQGLAAIQGARLSESAEHYFDQSEQIPTKIKLACGQVIDETGSHWRGGAMMIQKIAGDSARGNTDDAWETARSLFATLSDEELIDPDLSQNKLLYRLFHESGVRVVEAYEVRADCRCSRERLENMLKSFTREALDDMAEDDEIIANCEFCGTDYIFDLDDISPVV